MERPATGQPQLGQRHGSSLSSSLPFCSTKLPRASGITTATLQGVCVGEQAFHTDVDSPNSTDGGSHVVIIYARFRAAALMQVVQQWHDRGSDMPHTYMFRKD